MSLPCPLNSPAVCGPPAFPAPNYTQVVVDDHDPAVTYSGRWTSGGLSGFEYDGTLSYSGQGGTGLFGFNGTSVSLFGTAPLPGGYCNISYTVDNNPPTLSSTPVSDTSNVTLFGALLYNSPALAAGQHVLNFTVVACDPPARPFFVDYLIYQPSTASTSGGQLAAGPSSVSSAASTASPRTSLPASASTGDNNTALYALAAVLGVVLLLALLAVGWLLFSLRRMKRDMAPSKLFRNESINRHLDPELRMSYTSGIHAVPPTYIAAPGPSPGVLTYAAMSELPGTTSRLSPHHSITATQATLSPATLSPAGTSSSLSYNSVQPTSVPPSEKRSRLTPSQSDIATSSASPYTGDDQPPPPLYVEDATARKNATAHKN